MVKEIPSQVAVIMAGGAGERFWPLSRQDRPKQLLNLANDTRTMLQEAVDRIVPLIPVEHVYVITGARLKKPIQDATLGIPDGNVIAEPCKRNTAGALAWVTAVLLAKYGGKAKNITMAVLTADHQIADNAAFRETVSTALEAAGKERALVTIGIAPLRPETGYGYVERMDSADPIPDLDSEQPVYAVARFLEKPDRERAEKFLASGRHYWNSGMFFWRIGTFMDALSITESTLAGKIQTMAEHWSRHRKLEAEKIFESIESISIDYALMETAPIVLMVVATFQWDDVGAWDAMDRIRQKDDAGNVTVGDPILVDTRDCIVYNEPGAENIAVSVVGVNDLVVVVAQDAVLVIPKDRVQEVRLVVQQLKDKDANQL